MGGWVKLHRRLKEKPIWTASNCFQKTLLITLLLMANHKEKEWEWRGKPFKAKPGQMVTSVPSLILEIGKEASRQKIRTALERFEKYDFLTVESTKTNSLVTIVNWEQYQSRDFEDNQRNNQQITNDQPTSNQRVTTNKNDKNIKNDKKYIPQKFSEFWLLYPNKVGKQEAEKKYNRVATTLEMELKIIKSLSVQKEDWGYKQTDKKFIPHPTTWLNQGRYEDEIEMGKVLGGEDNPWLI